MVINIPSNASVLPGYLVCPTSPRRETSLFNSPGLEPGFFLPERNNAHRFIALRHTQRLAGTAFGAYNLYK